MVVRSIAVESVVQVTVVAACPSSDGLQFLPLVWHIYVMRLTTPQFRLWRKGLHWYLRTSVKKKRKKERTSRQIQAGTPAQGGHVHDRIRRRPARRGKIGPGL